MRYIRNQIYRGIFYMGVYLGLWPAPLRRTIKSLGLSTADFSKDILKIALDLQEKGHEAYIVGGCIRDLLKNPKTKPKDFDVVTSALPEQVKRTFSRSRIIGKRFKIVHVPAGRDIIEVSTFRGQGSWFSQWRGVRYKNNIYGTIEQDTWRRDFSCNALYYDVKKGQVIDFTGGIKDIKAKNLNVIGNPARRFKDDPVRILRALRFMAKMKFSIDQEIENQINRKKDLLRQVSKDRLLLEVVKLFSQGHSIESLEALKKFHCLEVLFSGYERLDIKLDHYMKFFKASLSQIDHQYRQKKRLSSSFLFSVLLWPILEVQKKRQKRLTLFHLKKTIQRVLKFESRYVAIPKKLQEAIKELWILQYAFETKTVPFAQERMKHARFQYAYLLFTLRSRHDESLTDKAIMWQDMGLKTAQ